MGLVNGSINFLAQIRIAIGRYLRAVCTVQSEDNHVG